MKKDPLILTLKLDENAQHYFDALRDKYFPKHVNYLRAHLTLFHVLPDEQAVIDTVRSFSERKRFEMQVAAVHNIGNGNAFVVESPELQELHLQMQKHFTAFLVSQDRQRLWPHITVQNKVTAHKAQQTNLVLALEQLPFSITAMGLSVWRYLNGPWEHVSDFLFL